MGVLISPKLDFYKLYDNEQVADIVYSLENFQEIPHKYTYFNESAALWDRYAKRMAGEEQPNSLTSTIRLLRLNHGYLKDLLGNKRVNVIDIGPGNAMPVRGLLESLSKDNQLDTYKAIDISREMLSLAHDNVTRWFGDKMAFEEYVLDIGSDSFRSQLSQLTHSSNTTNVVLFLGGTIGNVRSPELVYKKIHDSLNSRDVFILGLKLDTINSRKYFNFTEGVDLPEMEASILKRLNILPDYFEVEKGYDEVKKERYIRIRLKQDITIRFSFGGNEKDVKLRRKETILLWRYWHYDNLSILEQLSKAGFVMLHTSLTADEETLVVIARTK